MLTPLIFRYYWFVTAYFFSLAQEPTMANGLLINHTYSSLYLYFVCSCPIGYIWDECLVPTITCFDYIVLYLAINVW